MHAAMAGRGDLGRATLLVTLCAAPSCRHAPAPPDPAAPPAAGSAVQSALDEAVARYHDRGELEPLRAWVERNPEHEDAEIWREVVALRSYEQIAIGDPSAEAETVAIGDDLALASLPDPDPAELVALAVAYPGTIAGRTAQAMIEADGLRRLTEPALNPVVVRFLDGDDDWALVDGVSMIEVDGAEFRQRHEVRLAACVAQRLLDDGCQTTMGYCTWWVRRFPNAEVTAAIAEQMQHVWYRRAHPRWQGRNHAHCTFGCARKCRQGAAPLDDGCYEPCVAGC
jgi:hypothetical protein